MLLYNLNDSLKFAWDSLRSSVKYVVFLLRFICHTWNHLNCKMIAFSFSLRIKYAILHTIKIDQMKKKKNIKIPYLYTAAAILHFVWREGRMFIEVEKCWTFIVLEVLSAIEIMQYSECALRLGVGEEEVYRVCAWWMFKCVRGILFNNF